MFSESFVLFGTTSSQGGAFIVTAAAVVVIAALLVCAGLYLLLRKATAAREELLALNRDMEKAVKAKSEFLVAMSHEIRTPMNALTSFTEILTQRVSANYNVELKEEIDGILDIIKRSCHDLLNIVNDVFDYIKIDANLLEIESVPMSIKQVIHDVCHVEKPNVIAKHLDLTIKYSGEVPPTILSDPVRIRQILSNLIGNAVKYTEKGTITVLCEIINEGGDSSFAAINSSGLANSTKEAKEPSGNRESFSASSMQLKISVIDTGVGISAAHVQELFKPFKQLDSPSSQHNRGAGLGLSIAMRLARLMDGTIEVESTPGQGSTFSLLLSVYVPQGAPAALMERGNKGTRRGSQLFSGLDIRMPNVKKSDSGTPDKSRPLRNVRILVVEDMVVNQVIVATLLRDAGAQVELADNGAMGVQKVMQDMDNGLYFDVILLDMQMPVMDGYEAAAYLRKHGYQRPIVAVTAHALTGDREKTLKAGCNDYIAKPIDNQSLIGIIKKYTG
jgi:signal transduction histidine kinase/CheY-like chemotaxis protein